MIHGYPLMETFVSSTSDILGVVICSCKQGQIKVRTMHKISLKFERYRYKTQSFTAVALVQKAGNTHRSQREIPDQPCALLLSNCTILLSFPSFQSGKFRNGGKIDFPSVHFWLSAECPECIYNKKKIKAKQCRPPLEGNQQNKELQKEHVEPASKRSII